MCISSTHWGQVTYKCISKLTTTDSDNGLSHGRLQAIIWTNAGFLLIGPLSTNYSEIFIKILTFSSKKMHLKMLSGKWWPFCLSLNVLKGIVFCQNKADALQNNTTCPRIWWCQISFPTCLHILKHPCTAWRGKVMIFCKIIWYAYKVNKRLVYSSGLIHKERLLTNTFMLQWYHLSFVASQIT